MENGVKTYEQIKPGEYTVTEDTGSGKSYITTHKVGSDGTEESGTEANVTLPTEGITIAFTNTYKEADITLDAEKIIDAAEGITVPEETFTFTLTTGDDESVPMPEDTSASITGAGKVSTGGDSFGAISYSQEGVYVYTITETAGSIAGWTYNVNGPVTATVTVAADDNGALNASVVYSKGTVAAEITNRFESIKKHFEVEKSINNWGKATSFTFKLERVTENAPMPSSDTAMVKKGESLTAVFGDIEYNKEGVYEYTISEVDDKAAGITYDTNPHEVKVTVSKADDGSNSLTATVAYDGNKELEITNTYNTKGGITFSGKKTLKNRRLNEGEFEFELYDSEEKLIETVKNKADGSYSFTRIDYTGADLDTDDEGNYITTTKKYKVIEKTGALKGVTYDTKKYDITVMLKDDGKGNIEAAASPDKDSYNFTNEYQAAGEVDLKVKKAVTGASWPKGGKVTFTVTASKGIPMPEKTSLMLTEAVTADFGTIKYTIDDAGKTYTYTIKETAGFGSDWTAVPDKITATVAVGEDNGDGTLKECRITYSPKDATITNMYSKKSNKSGVKTGDSTPIVPYLILFLAAAIIILEESVRRLRKKK